MTNLPSSVVGIDRTAKDNGPITWLESPLPFRWVRHGITMLGAKPRVTARWRGRRIIGFRILPRRPGDAWEIETFHLRADDRPNEQFDHYPAEAVVPSLVLGGFDNEHCRAFSHYRGGAK